MVSSLPSDAAKQFADKFMAKAPEEVLKKLTVELLAGLRLFSGPLGDREMAVKPFLDILSQYPADCAVAALKSARRHGPKVQAEDVARDAADMAQDRFGILNAIRWTIANPDADKWYRMTDDERAENRKRVRELLSKRKDEK